MKTQFIKYKKISKPDLMPSVIEIDHTTIMIFAFCSEEDGYFYKIEGTEKEIEIFKKFNSELDKLEEDDYDKLSRICKRFNNKISVIEDKK